MRLTRSILLFGCVVLGPMSAVWAQTNEEAFEQFQWRLSTPGARANAMGGAVVAWSDDPGAGGLVNPAGLIHVGRPRLSVEFGRDELRVGRFAAVDALFTGALTRSRETTSTLSSVGGTLPLGGNRVAIALARHEVLAYKSAFQLPPRVLPGVNGPLRVQIPVDSQVDYQVISYAASVGAAVHDSLRLGLTLSVDRLRADSLSTRHFATAGPGTFDLTKTAIIANQSRVTGTDVGVGFIAGGIYQPVQAIAVGVVFAHRPSFTVSGDFQLNPGLLRRVNEPLASQTGFPQPVSLNLPDQITAGVALRPHARLLLAVDARRMQYSDLTEGLMPVLAFDHLTDDDFRINDATELHLGGEINVASDRNPVFLRAGLFTSHDHRLKFVGNVVPDARTTPAQAQRLNVYLRSVFNLLEDETDVRGTFGGGFAIGPRGQVDVAYVWRERFLISMGIGL